MDSPSFTMIAIPGESIAASLWTANFVTPTIQVTDLHQARHRATFANEPGFVHGDPGSAEAEALLGPDPDPLDIAGWESEPEEPDDDE